MNCPSTSTEGILPIGERCRESSFCDGGAFTSSKSNPFSIRQGLREAVVVAHLQAIELDHLFVLRFQSFK